MENPKFLVSNRLVFMVTAKKNRPGWRRAVSGSTYNFFYWIKRT